MLHRKNILVAILIVLFANWVLVLFTNRIDDVPLSADLSLLSLMPLNYIVSLFALVILTLVSAYWRENRFAIIFAVLFGLEFSGTPWLLEPLRISDSLFHFSRVAEVISSAHTPIAVTYYFDFPGSTFFGSIFLLVTGIDSITFLEIVFPLLSLAFSILGFSVLLFSFFKDLRVVSVGILIATLFSYGAINFSPNGVAMMLFPLLLFSLGRKRYSLSFLILAIGIVISNPTITAFLVATLVCYFILTRIIERKLNKILVYQTAFLVTIFIAWALFISRANVLTQVSGFFEQILNFISGQGTTEGLNPTVFPLVMVSFARRAFTILSGVLAVVVLLFAGVYFLKSRRNWIKSRKALNNLFGPSMILVGLALTFLFFIALPENPFGTRSITFYCIGIAFSVGFLNLKSKKILLILVVFLSALIIPSFVYAYGLEQYSLIRTSTVAGLSFTGEALNSNPGQILIPFGSQLQSFSRYDLWNNINTLSIPYFGATSTGFSLFTAKYFVYRTDAQYYDYLNNVNITGYTSHGAVGTFTYSEINSAVLNNTGYSKIYSSGSYDLFYNANLK